MNDQTPEERFNEFLKNDAERWRAHEAEVAALKAAVCVLVSGPWNTDNHVDHMKTRLLEAEAGLDLDAHPAGRGLLTELRKQIEANRPGWKMDGRLPGSTMS